MEGKGAISLTFSQSINNVKISLYDFNATNENMQIEEKEFSLLTSNEETMVFEELKLASYMLKIEEVNCIQYIGGIEGINFNDK